MMMRFLINDPVVSEIDPNVSYPQVGVGFMYSNKAFYGGFSLPKMIDLDTLTVGGSRFFPHYYAVFGGKIYTNNDKLLIRPEVWIRHAYDDVRSFNFSDRIWLFDIGVNLRYELSDNLDNYLMSNLSIDSNYSARLGVGLVTKMSDKYDLKFGANYSTQPQYFRAGGTFELSLAVLMRTGGLSQGVMSP